MGLAEHKSDELAYSSEKHEDMAVDLGFVVESGVIVAACKLLSHVLSHIVKCG